MGLQVTCSGHYKKGDEVVWLQEGRVQGGAWWPGGA